MILLLSLCTTLVRSQEGKKEQTLYELLEVPDDASDELIRKSFRKLSRDMHPDRHPGNEEIRLRYLAMNRAFDILTDVGKRITYDLEGEVGLEDYEKGKRKPKGGDFRTETSVFLDDFYKGAAKVFSFQRGQVCKKCKGSGDASGKMGQCPKCKGVGMVQKVVNFGGEMQELRIMCVGCKGTGRGGRSNCPTCGGKKITMQPRSLHFTVEKGQKDGDIVVFKGESQQTLETYPGDVYVTLRQSPHGVFKRRGNNLYTDITISLEEAILGFTKQIKQLDGRMITVQSGQISQDGRVIVVPGEGMPLKEDNDKAGDLYVRVKVNFPKSFTQEQKDQIRQIYEGEDK